MVISGYSPLILDVIQGLGMVGVDFKALKINFKEVLRVD